jgi:hypothetical protein
MQKPGHRLIVTCALLAIAFAGIQPVFAQDEVDEDAPSMDSDGERCLVTRRISRTKVVDDRTIIFYMRGTDTYVNILPRSCNGLRRENRFSYQAQSSRLCDIDGIVVLYQAGASLRAGANCKLGLFHPITREDAKAIIEGPSTPPPNPLPMPEPEEVGEAEVDPES